ncbi:MAG TPA: M50 family metallopeptidase [Actinomycetota bacterium]|nr:M50 family metallopeptidase [Actinomycetota bacterium]
MSGWLGVLVFVAALLVVILIHESGHFFVARAFRIKVEEFFVGFGPRLWSVRRGETEYGLKALPFGGYVRIAGMNPFQEVAPEDLPRSYGAKPVWQRALVIAAGPVTHFLMAVAFLALFFAAIGVYDPSRPLVEQVEPTLGGRVSPAAAAGLRPGDEVVAVDGRPVRSIDALVAYTRQRVGRPLTLTVRRDGEELTLRATPVLSEVGGERVGRLGVVLGAARERLDPVLALGRAAVRTGLLIKGIVLQLEDVFGPRGLARIGELLTQGGARRPTDPTGIVGGARLASEAVRAGAWDYLFELLVVFNVFIGVINLVPLPPLDGGHLAVLAYEKLARRRPDLRKLVPISALVTAYLVVLALSVTYIDIVAPLPNPFQ